MKIIDLHHMGNERTVAAYLLARLTGVLAQDHANASSTLLYDVTTGTWSGTLVEAADLDPDLLPPIRPSTEVAGTLLPAAAELLGLGTHCRVVVGTGDEHAATLGAGAAGPGLVVDVTGTAEPVCAVSDTVVAASASFSPTSAFASSSACFSAAALASATPLEGSPSSGVSPAASVSSTTRESYASHPQENL